MISLVKKIFCENCFGFVEIPLNGRAREIARKMGWKVARSHMDFYCSRNCYLEYKRRNNYGKVRLANVNLAKNF